MPLSMYKDERTDDLILANLPEEEPPIEHAEKIPEEEPLEKLDKRLPPGECGPKPNRAPPGNEGEDGEGEVNNKRNLEIS